LLVSRKHVITSCEASLKRLQTDYIDLYYIHGPDPAKGIRLSFRTQADGPRSWHPKGLQAKQLYTSWAHPKYKLQISLLLEYQDSNTKSRDIVIVHCRLQPQLDNSRHDKFGGRLKASGQYRAFNRKLDTYRNPQAEVELTLIDRDIRNNKADDNLIEYRRIMVEKKQAIDGIIRRVNETR